MGELKVLLVDDEITILEGFRELFDWESWGCELVGEAMDGVSAIHMADTKEPDLVIIDINLPILNGIEVVKTLQRRHARMQFVIVSGYDDFKYCQEALRLNVLDQ